MRTIMEKEPLLKAQNAPTSLRCHKHPQKHRSGPLRSGRRHNSWCCHYAANGDGEADGAVGNDKKTDCFSRKLKMFLMAKAAPVLIISLSVLVLWLGVSTYSLKGKVFKLERQLALAQRVSEAMRSQLPDTCMASYKKVEWDLQIPWKKTESVRRKRERKHSDHSLSKIQRRYRSTSPRGERSFRDSPYDPRTRPQTPPDGCHHHTSLQTLQSDRGVIPRCQSRGAGPPAGQNKDNPTQEVNLEPPDSKVKRTVWWLICGEHAEAVSGWLIITVGGLTLGPFSPWMLRPVHWTGIFVFVCEAVFKVIRNWSDAFKGVKCVDVSRQWDIYSSFKRSIWFRFASVLLQGGLSIALMVSTWHSYKIDTALGKRAAAPAMGNDPVDLRWCSRLYDLLFVLCVVAVLHWCLSAWVLIFSVNVWTGAKLPLGRLVPWCSETINWDIADPEKSASNDPGLSVLTEYVHKTRHFLQWGSEKGESCGLTGKWTRSVCELVELVGTIRRGESKVIEEEQTGVINEILSRIQADESLDCSPWTALQWLEDFLHMAVAGPEAGQYSAAVIAVKLLETDKVNKAVQNVVQPPCWLWVQRATTCKQRLNEMAPRVVYVLRALRTEQDLTIPRDLAALFLAVLTKAKLVPSVAAENIRVQHEGIGLAMGKEMAGRKERLSQSIQFLKKNNANLEDIAVAYLEYAEASMEIDDQATSEHYRREANNLRTGDDDSRDSAPAAGA